MALIALGAGWETCPDTGKREFIVRLVAQLEEDIPNFTALEVWHQTPLVLSRADEHDALREKAWRYDQLCK